MPERFLGVEQARVGYGSGGARCMALANVSAGFARGRLTLVTGPSGSGKTTLLSLLGCLLRPDQGKVYVDGKDVTALSEGKRTKVRRDSIGFVFQAFRLLRSLSALDNVAIAGELAGSSNRRRARLLLEEFGLGAKLSRRPDELSGGEKQRVAIARALLRNPPIVLADEPTASLDSQSGQHISLILRDLAEVQKRTVVVVSHDPRWEKLAHERIMLEDGKIVSQNLRPIISDDVAARWLGDRPGSVLDGFLETEEQKRNPVLSVETAPRWLAPRAGSVLDGFLEEGERS